MSKSLACVKMGAGLHRSYRTYPVYLLIFRNVKFDSCVSLPIIFQFHRIVHLGSIVIHLGYYINIKIFWSLYLHVY